MRQGVLTEAKEALTCGKPHRVRVPCPLPFYYLNGNSSMNVRAIDFLVAHVQDVGEAVRFYRETLGINEEFIKDGIVTGDGEKDTWTEF